VCEPAAQHVMTIKIPTLTLISLCATLTLTRAQTNQTTGTAPAQPAQATTATPAASPGLSSMEQTLKDIKQPVSWLSWGADFRMRNEYFYDLITLNPHANLNEQDYFRFRGRLWTTIMPVDDVTLNARLASEPREWMKPAGYTVFKGHSGLDMTEGVFDNLNAKWTNVLGQPISTTVGRQDVFLGDGWLVGDGTPYDGSWTYFLDSARFSYTFDDQHTTVEAIGIIQDGRDNGWMPVINPGNRILTEQNEKGAILQIGNNSLKAANMTGYFIYKHDDALNMSVADAQSFHPDNADIYTLGGRLNGWLGDNWTYWVEGAYQFGQKAYPIFAPTWNTGYIGAGPGQDREINAFGANSKLSYLFKDKLKNQLTLSFEYLSGDNPGSSHDEMFDVLWGRWPRWSETGLYMYPAETRVGQEANLIRFGPTWTFSPIKDLEFSSSYYALFAPYDVPTLGATQTLPQGNPNRLFSDSGNFRGHFAQAVLKYKFSPHMTGHLWSEFLFPGDYYVHHAMMSFLRAELMFTL
jgi:Alginate export